MRLEVEKLSRAPLKERVHVLVLCDQPDATITKIRLAIPLRVVSERMGCEVKFVSFVSAGFEHLAWSDIVVVQRGASQIALNIAKQCFSVGKPVIYEVDDLIVEIPDFLCHHVQYIRNQFPIIEMMQGANHLTVTTPVLAGALNKYADSISVCPNYHAIDAIKIANLNDSGVVHLIVAASDKIRVDFIAEALILAKSSFEDRVKIVAVGPIADALRLMGVVCEKKEIIPHERFLSELCRYENPIGIIPLDNSNFSACKSPVKYFDYAVSGIAVIASDVSPYKEVIENGRTGLLVGNTTDEWFRAIELVVQNYGFRMSISAGAEENVRTHHHLGHAVDAWVELIEKLSPVSPVVERRRQSMHLERIRRGSPMLPRIRNHLRSINQKRKAFWRRLKE